MGLSAPPDLKETVICGIAERFAQKLHPSIQV